MRRLAGYPRGFYACLILILAALAITGLMLLPNMLLMRLDIESGIDLSGNLRLATGATHCGVAFLSMVVVGALLPVHVRSGLHRKQNRLTGISLLMLLAVALFSAVGVYYFGDEDLSRAASVVHAAGGVLILLLLVAHSIYGHLIHNRRRRHLRQGAGTRPQSAV